MKRLVALAVGVAMVAVVAPSATAQRRAQPVKTSLYLHGEHVFGDIDGVMWFLEDYENQMSPEEPEGSMPKSWRLGTTGLNTSCTGLPLGFPTWVGRVTGTITGTPKLTAHFASPATRVTARLWVDVPMFSCNEGYIEPHSEVVADIPAGQNEVEIEFDRLRVRSRSRVMIELLATGAGQQGRILYDAADTPSVLEFNCIPARGRTCIP